MDYFENIEARSIYYRKRMHSGLPVISEEESNRYIQIDSVISENRSLPVRFRPLLILYDHTGYEYPISLIDDHLLQRQLPARGRLHRHDFIEILYVLEGSFDQILLGEQLHFEKGTFVITDRNCDHADLFLPVDAAVLFLQLRTDYMEELLHSSDNSDQLQNFLFHALSRQTSEQSFLELRGEADPFILRLLELLYTESLQDSPGRSDILRGLLIRLFHRLCTDYELHLHSSSQSGKEKALLYEIERYIRLHPAEVSADILEEKFHYHRNYYTLLLKKYRSQSFREYLQQVRLSMAKDMLVRTDLSIKQIAHMVGYENTSHFYHLYEKRYGCSPSEHRKEQSRNSDA
ncbi:MAG: AraC family transcriptional regulator [Eubacteriales bacterium]|nr:AraC family transcriptional regulator [Eubacteriales bacterium]